MNVITKLNLVILFTIIVTYHNIYCTTQVTCIFKNTTKFPITFKSFQDNNDKPVEVKNMNIDESITSNISAERTVTYDIQANIDPYIPQLMTSGSFNIHYNSRRNKFSYEIGSFTQIDPGTQNAVLSVVQITNRTIFPIYISIYLKDTGQARQDPTTPTQGIHRIKLPIDGFYSVTNKVDQVTISPAINGYNSQPLPLYSIKSKYNIIDNLGSIKIIGDDQ